MSEIDTNRKLMSEQNEDEEEDNFDHFQVISANKNIQKNPQQQMSRSISRKNSITSMTSQKTFNSSKMKDYSKKDLQNIALSILIEKPPGTRKPTDIMFLRKYTEDLAFFEQMDIKTAPDAHKLVCKKLHYEYHEEGRDILQKGGESDKFYLIIEGAVSVLNLYEEKVKDEETGEERIIECEEELANLDKGDHFGEIGIIKNQVRAATIRATQDSHFAVLKKDDFLKIISSLEEIELNRKIEFLRQLPLFQYLTTGSLELIIYNFKREKYIKNQNVIQENQKSEFVYAVYKGEFMLTKHFEIPRQNQNFGTNNEMIDNLKQTTIKKEFQIANIFKGELFGDIDCMLNEKNHFSVQCSSQEGGEVLKIQRKHFLRRLMDSSDHPEVNRYINEYLDEKIQWRNEKVKKIKKIIYDKQEFMVGVFKNKRNFNIMNLVENPKELTKEIKLQNQKQIKKYNQDLDNQNQSLLKNVNSKEDLMVRRNPRRINSIQKERVNSLQKDSSVNEISFQIGAVNQTQQQQFLTEVHLPNKNSHLKLPFVASKSGQRSVTLNDQIICTPTKTNFNSFQVQNQNLNNSMEKNNNKFYKIDTSIQKKQHSSSSQKQAQEYSQSIYYDRYVSQKIRNFEYIQNENRKNQHSEDYGYLNAEISVNLKKQLGLIKKPDISPNQWRKKPEKNNNIQKQKLLQLNLDNILNDQTKNNETKQFSNLKQNAPILNSIQLIKPDQQTQLSPTNKKKNHLKDILNQNMDNMQNLLNYRINISEKKHKNENYNFDDDGNRVTFYNGKPRIINKNDLF